MEKKKIAKSWVYVSCKGSRGFQKMDTIKEERVVVKKYIRKWSKHPTEAYREKEVNGNNLK